MKDDTKEARKASIESLPSDVQVIGSSFSLPLGTHSFLVADKDAFALLNVRRKSDNKQFALPIIAGTVTTNEGIKHTVEATDRPGAKTLVFPADAFLEMQCNATYDITIEERSGRKVITTVNIKEEVAA